MLEEISKALARLGPRRAFCAQAVAPSNDLGIEVPGVGPVRLPVAPGTARKLCSVARPTRYGLREKTLRDPRVRDSWEIPAARVRIDERRWVPTLQTHLSKLQADLGIDPDRELKAELHNLLVYEPGHFFAPHQDSEKQAGMIASLVVVLPSSFTGGELVVEHLGAKVTHRGSDSALSLIAFYADCHHEVRPVKDGYRLALTYNLILEAARPTREEVASAAPPALARAVKAHFETPRPARWGKGDPHPPPDRLVYLLDHQYTPAGLGWDALKSADASRAAALQKVAGELDCEVRLALADVHESWSCEDEWDGRESRGRWSRRYETDDVEDEDAAAEGSPHTLIERIDWDVELRHWLAPDGKKAEEISSAVEHDELCSTRPSTELEPFRSEHEGYMGNYGNTVDHWYHRAAVVLWPKERTFVIRAKASPSWALREVSKVLKAQRLEDGRALVRRIEPFWEAAVRRDSISRLSAAALSVAAGVEQPALATSLLRPLTMEQATPKSAPAFRLLIERYGAAWCSALFAQWDGKYAGEERLKWMESSLSDFCRGMVADGSEGTFEVARALVASQLEHLDDQFAALQKTLPGDRVLAQLARLQKPLLGLLESSHWARSDALRLRIVELVSVEDPRLASWLVAFLRAARQEATAALYKTMGLPKVEEHCRRLLEKQLAQPPRRDDDWSVTAPKSCGCELCKKLGAFLQSPRETRLEWPLAAQRRSHVHGMLDSHELPVTHVTRRSGSPYTLVLSKKPSIFDQASAERSEWEKGLRWLERRKR